MFEKVCTILAEFSEINANDMTETSDILNDLGINSLEIMDAVIRFEDEFDIEIPDRIISNFHTVGDIWKYICLQTE